MNKHSVPRRDNDLNTPVRYLKGVGPKKSEDLAAVGIATIEDILYYLPFRYEDRSRLVRIRDLRPGETQMIRGEIMTCGVNVTKAGVLLFQAMVADQSGHIHVTWYRQPYLRNVFAKGQHVTLYGKVERYDRLQMIQPEYEIEKEDAAESVSMGRIVPVYPATSKLSQKYLRGLIHSALMLYAKSAPERLPTYLVAREHLVDARFALHAIHFPENFENLEKAYRRIVFEEFFTLQLALALRKKEMKSGERGLSHGVDGALLDAFRASLPFELTGGQAKAIADIEHDMASGRPMNRLVEGDVGSGKTVVAAHALVLTVQNGYQGVIMAPTEVLARQHFITLTNLLMPLGINVALLVGGLDEETRASVYNEIREGRVQVVVGTHAIIQEGVDFNKLGLAVVDEQHKFGVSQRSLLKQKGYSPHILIMTATPIPRTLSMTVYGDLDVSIMRELPRGRKPIVTYCLGEEKREKVYAFIREELKKGRQAYVICPAIEEARIASGWLGEDKGCHCEEPIVPQLGDEAIPQSDANAGRNRKGRSSSFPQSNGAKCEIASSDKRTQYPPRNDKASRGVNSLFNDDELGGAGAGANDESPAARMKAAIEEFDRLRNEIFADMAVGLLHGRMTSKEKEHVMKEFKKGAIKVLVSTVVIEVGIDVPNATVMLIENADRFGLSQLHQLRGRIGRGQHESFCILLAEPRTDEARERLRAIEESTDGFKIAEADLNIRGPGEFFGTRQHGLPEIRFGNIVKDVAIMESARKEAFALVSKDPNLREEHHRLLKSALSARFKGKLELAKIG